VVVSSQDRRAPGVARGLRDPRPCRPTATPASRSAARGAAPGAWAPLALAALAALGCDPYVHGDGVYREQPRDAAPFHAISLTDGLSATVTAGSSVQALTVSGDENVLQYVDTSVVNGVLVAKMNASGYDSTHPIRVVATVPAIDSLAAAAASTIVAKGVAAPNLAVDGADGSIVQVSGPGGGASGALQVGLRGGGHGGAHLDATGYPAHTASVELAGGSHAALAVDGTVSGTAADASVVTGAGSCAVTLSGGSTCGL
jgi:hypothetical protein